MQPTLGVATSDSALLYVILSPVGAYFKSTDQQVGVSLLADPKYTRAWPGGCGDSKLGSNYGPTIQVQQEATEKGLQQVLWLFGENNEVTEIGTMNVFVVYINDNGGKKHFWMNLCYKIFLKSVIKRNDLITIISCRKRITYTTPKRFDLTRNCEKLASSFIQAMESI